MIGSSPWIALGSMALFLSAHSARLAAQTMLQPGDIAVVGFASDDLSGSGGRPKEFAFVTFVPLQQNTTISFTDNGWQEPEGSFRTGEGITIFTAPIGGVAQGTVVVLPAATGNFNLSTAGDQIFAFQGTIDFAGNLTGSLLHGINFEGAGVWQATATSTNTSAQPPALSGNLSAAFPEIDNGAFNTGVLSSGTKAQWLSAIGNASNWTFSDTTQPMMPSGPLIIVPEPASSGLACSAAVALGAWRARGSVRAGRPRF